MNEIIKALQQKIYNHNMTESDLNILDHNEKLKLIRGLKRKQIEVITARVQNFFPQFKVSNLRLQERFHVSLDNEVFYLSSLPSELIAKIYKLI